MLNIVAITETWATENIWENELNMVVAIRRESRRIQINLFVGNYKK